MQLFLIVLRSIPATLYLLEQWIILKLPLLNIIQKVPSEDFANETKSHKKSMEVQNQVYQKVLW